MGLQRKAIAAANGRLLPFSALMPRSTLGYPSLESSCSPLGFDLSSLPEAWRHYSWLDPDRMSVTVDIAHAKSVFLAAIQLVDSGATLPEEWTERARRVGKSPNRTFVAMLGTALLSRATDPRIDPLTLKAGAVPAPGFQSYSARAVATAVLAPMALEHRINIGTRGREPLNNQPFFRYDMVHEAMVVRSNARPHLIDLVNSLEALRGLEESSLLPALAAYLAVRRVGARRPTRRIEVAATSWNLSEFVQAVSDFVVSWPEDGKRGQALVAAALDLAFEQVTLGHVNDPGRRIPGDVYAFAATDNAETLLPAEVKQKVATKADVTGWARALSQAGIRRGMYVLLTPGQPEVNSDEFVRLVLAEHDVVVTVYESAEAFLLAAITWSNLNPAVFMTSFAMAMQARLDEADVTPETVEAWIELFSEQ